jgi:hypothetical protein
LLGSLVSNEYSSLLLTIDVNGVQLQKTSVLDKTGLEARSFIEAGGTIHFGNILYLQNMLPQKAHYNTRFMHTVLQKVECNVALALIYSELPSKPLGRNGLIGNLNC